MLHYRPDKTKVFLRNVLKMSFWVLLAMAKVSHRVLLQGGKRQEKMQNWYFTPQGWLVAAMPVVGAAAPLNRLLSQNNTATKLFLNESKKRFLEAIMGYLLVITHRGIHYHPLLVCI